MSSRTGRHTRAARHAVGLAVAALALAACSATQQPAADLNPQTGATAQNALAQNAAGTPSGSGTTTANTPAFGGAQTPDAALSTWLTALVKGDYPAACKVMGQKGAKGGPPTAPTQALCGTLAADKAGHDLLAGLHKSFTPAGTAPASVSVVVTGVVPTGTSASVTDTQIKVGGKLLRDVIIANSKGLPAGKSVATFQVSQIGKLWYVTDFALKS